MSEKGGQNIQFVSDLPLFTIEFVTSRQVGKTFSIREYGKRHFESVVEINFLRDRDAKGLKEAGIGLVCTSVDDPKVPLKLTQDSSFFKLFMNDVGLLSAMYMDNVQYRISHAALDKLLAREGYGIRRALVLSTANADRDALVDYLPVYLIAFLDHDGLPPDLTFPKPSLDLAVSPHFGNRS